MATRLDLTLDCADAHLLATFWRTALGYVDEPPPSPFATRGEWLASFGLSEEETANDGAWLCDPDGVGPACRSSGSPNRRGPRTASTSTSACRATAHPGNGGPGSWRRPTA